MASASRPSTRQQHSATLRKAAEYYYPPVGGMVAAGLYLWWFRDTELPKTVKELFPSVLNVASLLVGFLGTTAALLLSIDDKWILRRAYECGAYRNLIDHVISAAFWGFAVAVSSAIAVLFDWDHQQIVHRYLFACWLLLTATMALAIIRVLRVTAIVLRYIAEPPE